MTKKIVFSEEQKAVMRKFYVDDLESIERIAIRFKVSEPTINRQLRQLGVKIRTARQTTQMGLKKHIRFNRIPNRFKG